MHSIINELNNHPQNKWNRVVRKHPDWIAHLSVIYPFTQSLNEQIWLLMNNITTRPKCASTNCNNEVTWTNNNHYTNTCCPKCAYDVKQQTGAWNSIKEKQQATMLERYGVKNASQLASTQQKIATTKLTKYGSGQSEIGRQKARDRSTELNIKGRETIRSRYGVINVSQLPEVKHKVKQTLLEKWGVETPGNIPHIIDRRKTQTHKRWIDLYQTVTILDRISDSSVSVSRPSACDRIKFQCNKCNIIDTLPSETFKFRFREYGTACTTCADIKRCRSKTEQEIANYIQQLGVSIKQNDRSLITPQELDIVCFDQNIAIEYCGLYWHSDLNGKDKKYHITKQQRCEAVNFRLVTIFEDEWINKSDIVKSRLRNIFRGNTTKYMARKLNLKKISNKVANKFCNQHHIQGAGRTDHAWGLFDTDILVAVMTFANINVAKGGKSSPDIWELNRFCVVSNTTVIGGASKMFSAALTELDPRSVISYSDLRWNTGKLYQQLGFNYQHHTPPNYWYINWKKCSRMHRFGFRKNSDDDQSLTEWENRQQQGLNRIWDCGNIKWIWTKK